MKITLTGIEAFNGNSAYVQPKGFPIIIGLSGKNNRNTMADFFAEARYQHGIESYAAAMGAPVIRTY